MTGPSVLGLLPVRGGSKGMPGKNLRELLGRPLMSWAATSLNAATRVSRGICSTDDTELAAEARRCGLEVPTLRPVELAQDSTLVVDVALHALQSWFDSAGRPFSHIAIVQATSPTVLPGDIDAAVELSLRSGVDTVISGFHCGQRHPSTMFTLDEAGNAEWLIRDSSRMARRQDLTPVFIRTGLVYVIKAEVIVNLRSLYGESIQALIVPEERAVTIDSEHDFLLAEEALRRADT